MTWLKTRQLEADRLLEGGVAAPVRVRGVLWWCLRGRVRDVAREGYPVFLGNTPPTFLKYVASGWKGTPL